jgi:predicted outer membrane lipoprotein
MNDIKNFYFAWIASVPLLAAFEPRSIITIVSAIVLPMICFLLGKTIDVLVQVYLHNKKN